MRLTPSATSTNNPNSDASGILASQIALIVIMIIAVLAAIAAFIIACAYLFRNKKEPEETASNLHEPEPQEQTPLHPIPSLSSSSKSPKRRSGSSATASLLTRTTSTPISGSSGSDNSSKRYQKLKNVEVKPTPLMERINDGADAGVSYFDNVKRLLSSSRGRRQSSLNSRQQFMVVNIREEDEEEGKPTSILKGKENVEICSTKAHFSLVPSALMATINDDVEAGVSYSVPPKKTKKSEEALKYAANIGEIEPIVSDSRPGSSESIVHSPINTKSSEAPKIQSTESNDLELPSNTVPISKTSDISSLTETNSRVSISAQRDSKIFDQSETNTSELPVRIQDTPRSLVISTQPSSSSNPLGMSMSNSPISSKSGKSPVIAIPPLSRTREDVNTPTLLDPEYEWMVRLALQAAEEEEKELDKDDKDKSFRRFGKFFTF